MNTSVPTNMTYVLVRYCCIENKYEILDYHVSEKEALNAITYHEQHYAYHYYSIYHYAGFNTEFCNKWFWTYHFIRMSASKRCGFNYRMPISPNKVLVRQEDEEYLVGCPIRESFFQ